MNAASYNNNRSSNINERSCIHTPANPLVTLESIFNRAIDDPPRRCSTFELATTRIFIRSDSNGVKLPIDKEEMSGVWFRAKLNCKLDELRLRGEKKAVGSRVRWGGKREGKLYSSSRDMAID